MTVSKSSLRARAAAACDAVAGWSESTESYDEFAGGSQARDKQEKCFAVGIPRTRFPAVEDTSTIRDGAGMAESILAVKGTVKVRADNRVSDYDTALDEVQKIRAAVLGMSVVDVSLLAVLDETHAVRGEWFHFESLFRVIHWVALT